MQDLTVELQRKYGIVPSGRRSNEISVRLMNRLTKDFNTINIDIKLWNGKKHVWHFFQLVGLDGDFCLLREKLRKPLTDEQKARLAELIKSDVAFDLNDFSGEEYLSDEITKISAVEILSKKDAYMAKVEVGNA